MTSDSSPPPIQDPAVGWGEDGAPRSGRFGDIYFSAEDGLAESRAVFLQGCGLPDAWRGRDRFTVGELGFGSGLNVAALLDLWRREGPDGATLHVFSVEAFPMRGEDIARALGRWPELAEIAQPLIARLPPRTPGFHRVDVPELRAVIDLAYLEVEAALDRWDGRADAWFLDGFAPAANPAMWREAVLSRVAARSHPAARAATFTVAGEVRRTLAAAGFEVAKRPGFGRKRERLEAVLAGTHAHAFAPRSAAIIGAGVAGAALVRAFRALGCDPVLIERAHPGAGASGVPAALVTPRFDAAGGAVAQLFAQAWERAAHLYRREAPQAVLAEGVLQLEHQARDARRFDTIARQALWEAGAVSRRTAVETSTALGEATTPGGLFLRDALAIDPRNALAGWIGDVETVHGEAASLQRVGERTRVLDASGATLAETDVVCLAAGAEAGRFLAADPIKPVRGQATIAPGSALSAAFAWGGYATPARDGVLFGATHDRDDDGDDLRAADDRRNLESLARIAPGLAASLDATTLRGWAGVRATTPDRLPLAGALAEGLFILGGLGSRGFVSAPLLAEHVAARALGVPSPLPRDLGTLVAPQRFRA
jgi:tRNA 5-methylaminomethyl-2-thiouridine biosynthesis bifunctional protein